MTDLSYEIPQFWPVDSSAPLTHSCNCKYSGVPLKGWLDAASGLIVSCELQNYAPTAERTQLQGELLWHSLCNVIQSNAMFSKHEPLCHFVFISTGLKKIKIKHTFKNTPLSIVSLQHYATSHWGWREGNDSVSAWGTGHRLARNMQFLFELNYTCKKRETTFQRVWETKGTAHQVFARSFLGGNSKFLQK